MGARRAVACALAGAVACACARDAPRTHRVAIENFRFVPESLVVAPGDTVEWTNADFVPHTATARDSAWDSKPIEGGGRWRLVAGAPGRHAYYCVAHPTMQGTLVVR